MMPGYGSAEGEHLGKKIKAIPYAQNLPDSQKDLFELLEKLKEELKKARVNQARLRDPATKSLFLHNLFLSLKIMRNFYVP